jgi:hypothetical protein
MDTTPRTRRSAIAAIVGTAVAGGVAALGRPANVRAADPNDVVLGATNTATTTTTVQLATTVNSPPGALRGVAIDHYLSIGNWIGPVGVIGENESATGVLGTGAIGVAGSGRIAGVIGDVNGVQPDAVAVSGYAANDCTAIFGAIQQTRHGTLTRRNTGVHGTAANANADGVGVFGQGGSWTGVLATGATAIKAVGTIGLDVTGQVRFSSAGLATLRRGRVSINFSPGVPITTRSKVLATLQTSAGGTTSVRRVARHTTTNRITIYLTRPATADCRIAWFVIG